MSNRKFTGSINGKTYKNYQEFLDALALMNDADIKSIQYSEVTEDTHEDTHPETDCKCKKCQKEIDMTDLNDKQKAKVKALDGVLKDIFGVGMTDIFGGFLKATQANNLLQPLKENADEDDNEIENEAAEAHFMDEDELEDKYIFPMTSYEFTGTERDDLELDKFDRLLQRRLNEFQEENIADDVDLDYLSDRFKDAFDNVSHKSSETDLNLHAIDVKIAKYEKLLDAQSELGLDTETTKLQLKNLQLDFEKMDAKHSYFELLKKYYTDIVAYLDECIEN